MRPDLEKKDKTLIRTKNLALSTIHTVSTTHGRLTGKWGAGLFYLPLLDSTPYAATFEGYVLLFLQLFCAPQRSNCPPTVSSPGSFFQNPWISCSSCPLQKHCHHVAFSIQLFSVVLARIFSENPVFNMKVLCHKDYLLY